MPMGRLVSIAYAMAVEGLSKKNRDQLDRDLNAPDIQLVRRNVGPTRVPPSWWHGEQEAYRSAMAVQKWVSSQ
jgi:hypothetical protein